MWKRKCIPKSHGLLLLVLLHRVFFFFRWFILFLQQREWDKWLPVNPKNARNFVRDLVRRDRHGQRRTRDSMGSQSGTQIGLLRLNILLQDRKKNVLISFIDSLFISFYQAIDGPQNNLKMDSILEARSYFLCGLQGPASLHLLQGSTFKSFKGPFIPGATLFLFTVDPESLFVKGEEGPIRPCHSLRGGPPAPFPDQMTSYFCCSCSFQQHWNQCVSYTNFKNIISPFLAVLGKHSTTELHL